MKRVAIVVVPLLLAVFVAAGVSTAAPPGAGSSIPDLSRALTVAALASSNDVCATSVARPNEVAPVSIDCAPEAGTSGVDSDPSAATSSAQSAESFTLHAAHSVETPRWYPAMSPLQGAADGEFVRVHGYGDVAAMTPDGTTRWNRPAMSFYRDWGVQPWIVPFVLLGASPIDPLVEASERPYAVGDLSGDGVDDVAVGHFVRLKDVDEDGKIHLSDTSAVTVLDGRDGHTLWAQLYPGYVSQVLVIGDTLVVGDETGNVRGSEKQGQDGSTTSLAGLRFAPSGDGDRLDASVAWTVSTGAQWARWLAAEPIGSGRFAAAWSPTPLNATGHVLLIDASNGATLWTRDTTGYPRTLHYDASRDEIVTAIEADPKNADKHLSASIVGLRAGDGSVAQTLSRPDAAIISLAVAPAFGAANHPWIVGEIDQLPATPNGTESGVYQASQVVSLVPESGAATVIASDKAATEEAQGHGVTVKVPYRVTPAANRLLVGWLPPGGGTALDAFDTGTGALAWSHTDDPGFPLYAMPDTVNGTASIIEATSHQVLRAFALSDGSVAATLPLLGDIWAAATADLNGDGVLDLVVGGESGAVFALDGTRLGENPGVLWTRRVAGPVHQLAIADLDAGTPNEVAGPEIAVAAMTGISVLHLDGSVAWSADLAPAYVWTLTVGDVDRNGRLDVVVPGTAVDAFNGATGAKLWSYRPDPSSNLTTRFSNAVVTPEGKVVAQFLWQPPALLGARDHEFVVAIDGTSGQRAWIAPTVSPLAIVDLWRGVALDPSVTGVKGTAVAATWDEAPDPTPGWYPFTDVYDSADGTKLFAVGPDRNAVVHMGTDYLPGEGLVEFNWNTVNQIRRQGGHEVQFEATSDVARANFGDLGPAFVRAWTGVDAYPSDATEGSRGEVDPESSASWYELYSGKLLVRDLDGNGSDEVVAWPFDWDGYSQVAAFAGVGVGHGDILPHGIAILDAAA